MSDYGRKIGNAVLAVKAMHEDTSKLLQDCDGTIGKGKESIFGNTVTRGLTWDVKGPFWMAEAVYRLYDCTADELGLAEGITVSFFDKKRRCDEPLLIVGRIRYSVGKDISSKPFRREWDLWEAFFDWASQQTLDEVLTPPTTTQAGRIEWIKLIAVPLYTVQKIEYVSELMERLRNHDVS